MSSSELNDWLRQGITAVKSGDYEQARTLLLQVLEIDEQNEKAWLWLSGVVATDEERRVCLENVLTINPDNKLAQKGLAKLAPAAEPAQSEADSPPPFKKTVIRRERTPLSTAAAILYPERQVEEWEWRDPTPDYQAVKVEYASADSYEDVWVQDVDICAYCAHVLEPDEERCPNCKRPLLTKYYRYPKPSSHLTVLWVLLLGIAQIYLLQIIYDVVAQRNLFAAVINGFLMLLFIGLTVGVYLRQFWAYTGTIIVLVLITVLAVTQFLAPINLDALGLAEYDPAISNFLEPAISGIGEFLKIFQLAAVGLAMIYAVFLTGADFDRVHVRQVATLTKGLNSAGEYHQAATRLAQAGLWASAVLHWQRAAAREPHQISYQRGLGRAYARLGFYERGLDVLQSAYNRSSNEVIRAEIKETIEAVQQKQAAQQANV